MPCYCDTPEEHDQAEIERRCKVRMYFDIHHLMTKEQIKLSNEMHIPSTPVGDVNERLCKLCSILNEDQLKGITAYYWQIKWPYETLHDWYIQHCKDDLEHKE